jgi:hypothetical protein
VTTRNDAAPHPGESVIAMDDTRTQALPQLTACPQCSAPAEILRRTVLESTDGPIEHAAVRCVERHHFLLPTARLRDDAGVTATRSTPEVAGVRPLRADRGC